jgi:hypothetical protein
MAKPPTPADGSAPTGEGPGTVRIDFDAVPWTSPAPGLRTKTHVRAGQQLRLLELSEGFVEPGWCTKAHAFRVLEGTFTLETPAGRERFAEGAHGLIAAGERHKASVEPGARALLLLFETP